jgi:hypothetical protein
VSCSAATIISCNGCRVASYDCAWPQTSHTRGGVVGEICACTQAVFFGSCKGQQGLSQPTRKLM